MFKSCSFWSLSPHLSCRRTQKPHPTWVPGLWRGLPILTTQLSPPYREGPGQLFHFISQGFSMPVCKMAVSRTAWQQGVCESRTCDKCKNVSRIRLRPQHFPSVLSLRHLRQSESGLPHFGVPGPLIWISEFRSKTVLVAAHPPCHLLPCLLPTVREPGCRLVLGNHPYLQKSLSLSHTSATCTLISSSQSCYLSTCSVN